MDLFAELNNLMVKYRFKPNKKMAQNFIIDQDLIELMAFHAELKPKDVVLEIGAGTGFLTRELQKKCKVVAIEFDLTLCELLRNELGKENLEIIEGDFLGKEIPKHNKIVALPPYTISSKLVYKLLLGGFESAVLVLQREFVNKLTAQPGFLKFGAISVFTQYCCEPKILIGNISPTSFYPKPNTFSSLIKLTYGKRFGEANGDKEFKFFLKSVFRFKNKNLSNALAKAFPFIKDKLKISEEDFAKKAKKLNTAEEKVNRLSVKQFVEIFNELTG